MGPCTPECSKTRPRAARAPSCSAPAAPERPTWLKQRFPNPLYLDLLDHALYLDLLTRPQRVGELIPPRHDDWVVLDEVQRVPLVLDEVHRLIETEQRRFILTGSSARSLRRRGVNLLVLRHD